MRIAVNPTTGACLSSAFGPRGRGQHRGLDFHAATGGPIFAAGDGVVIEMRYGDFDRQRRLKFEARGPRGAEIVAAVRPA